MTKVLVGNGTLLVFVCLLAGCGPSGPPTYPVSGQVVLASGGTLALGGRVVFVEEGTSPAVITTAYFGADGKFVLKSEGKGDGVVAGDYQVMVVPTVPDDGDDMSPREFARAMEPIDTRYQNQKSSGLRFTVAADTSPHDFRVEVTRPRRRR